MQSSNVQFSTIVYECHCRSYYCIDWCSKRDKSSILRLESWWRCVWPNNMRHEYCSRKSLKRYIYANCKTTYGDNVLTTSIAKQMAFHAILPRYATSFSITHCDDQQSNEAENRDEEWQTINLSLFGRLFPTYFHNLI